MRSYLFYLLLIIVCLPTSTNAQFKENVAHYYDYFAASSRTNREGNKDSAIIYARMAIAADTANRKPYWYLANLLIEKGKYKEGISLLRKDILNGATPPDKFQYLFSNYDAIKEKPEIVAFQTEILALTSQYYSTSYDHAFASMISRMMGYDQAIRGSYEKMKTEDSVVWNKAMSIQLYLDTLINLPELLTYLKTNGFPAYRSMDDKVSGDFQVIIHHIIAVSDGPQTQELHKLVQQAIYDGKYAPNSYMRALDWYSINRTGKQIYGTYIGPGPDGEITFAPEIENVATVDARRAKWKQDPLKDVPLSDWRAPKLPAGYKP
jgi:hypothetical protein